MYCCCFFIVIAVVWIQCSESQWLTSERLPFTHQYQPLTVLPNATEVRGNFVDLVDSTLAGLLAHRNVSLPVSSIINATLNGGNYPVIYDRQKNTLPNVGDDFICDPEVFPNGCSTLDSLGKALGIPANDWLMGSLLTHFQRRVGNTLVGIYNRATRGITPDLVLYLQRTEMRNGILGSLRSILIPLMPISESSPAWALWTNLTALGLWDPLDERLDPTEENFLKKRSAKQAIRAAALCRLFNGRVGACNGTASSLTDSGPNIVPTILSKATDPKTGYRKEIMITGIAESCTLLYADCQLGGIDIDANQFDGVYKFAGLDDHGFPLYHKRHVSFTQFQNIKSLWLIVLGYRSPTFPTGITAAIVPNIPIYTGTMHYNQLPIVVVTGVPPNCTTAASFPLCLSGYNPATPNDEDPQTAAGHINAGWALMRAVLTNCPVPLDIYSGLCSVHLSAYVI